MLEESTNLGHIVYQCIRTRSLHPAGPSPKHGAYRIIVQWPRLYVCVYVGTITRTVVTWRLPIDGFVVPYEYVYTRLVRTQPRFVRACACVLCVRTPTHARMLTHPCTHLDSSMHACLLIHPSIHAPHPHDVCSPAKPLFEFTGHVSSTASSVRAIHQPEFYWSGECERLRMCAVCVA